MVPCLTISTHTNECSIKNHISAFNRHKDNGHAEGMNHISQIIEPIFTSKWVWYDRETGLRF